MEKVLRQENRQDAGSAGALFSVSDRALISAMEQRGYLAMQGGSCFPAGDINRALTAVRGVTRYEDRDTLLGLGYTDEMLCYYGVPPETSVTESPFCGELYFEGWSYRQACGFLSDFLDNPPAISFGKGCDASVERDASDGRLKASFRCFAADAGSLLGCLRLALKRAPEGASGLILTPDGIIDIEKGKAACLPGEGPEESPGYLFAEDEMLGGDAWGRIKEPGLPYIQVRRLSFRYGPPGHHTGQRCQVRIRLCSQRQGPAGLRLHGQDAPVLRMEGRYGISRHGFQRMYR